MHFISDLLNSLDATSYFLVNSGVVIAITASIFFTFGLLFGALTWARYKKRWQKSNALIESLKADNSQFKRRLADMATRTLHASASQPVRTKYVPVNLPPAVSASPGPTPAFTPRSAAFTIWMEDGWSPQLVVLHTLPGDSFPVSTEAAPPQPLQVAHGFSIWTEDSSQEQMTIAKEIPEIPSDSWVGGNLNGHSTVNESDDLVHPFWGEMESGKVRHDFLLGIIFNEPPKKSDDLTRIKGINASCRNSLHAQGIYTYNQIALWTPVQVGEFARRLSLDARIQTERWIDQARELHAKKHGEKI